MKWTWRLLAQPGEFRGLSNNYESNGFLSLCHVASAPNPHPRPLSPKGREKNGGASLCEALKDSTLRTLKVRTQSAECCGNIPAAIFALIEMRLARGHWTFLLK